MIKTAVILAAGMSSRICQQAGGKPKGFLMIEDTSIIELSILKLLEKGITKIYIGTGYEGREYESLAFKYPQIQCVSNPNFASTGSLFTLFRFKDFIDDDFLLLESDLIYEKAALKSLIELDRRDVILASRLTNSHDEVFIETNESHFLVNMSKEKEKLNEIYGELVGISKLSCQTFQQLCAYTEMDLRTSEKMDYEDGLIEVAKKVEIYVHKLDGIVWCEVDDEQHWTRAVHIVYPLIQAREKAISPIKRNILLNPGPATTTDTIKYAQVVPDLCPREKVFGEVMEFISTELTKFAGSSEEYTTVLFGGSGTAAVESILSSCIDEEPVVIINNGSYGKRMCQIAGVSFVIAATKYIEETKKIKPRNLYLHLYEQYIHFKKSKQMRFTPPLYKHYML
ncbi:NTP transferase domain-containing protein [Cytobacillus depressus]|uniref:NTP transferase domain-containing protein n=1 Tax=Cytobacillus depressus TaxID=1602942 RepID=UPI0031B5C92E